MTCKKLGELLKKWQKVPDEVDWDLLRQNASLCPEHSEAITSLLEWRQEEDSLNKLFSPLSEKTPTPPDFSKYIASEEKTQGHFRRPPMLIPLAGFASLFFVVMLLWNDKQEMKSFPDEGSVESPLAQVEEPIDSEKEEKPEAKPLQAKTRETPVTEKDLVAAKERAVPDLQEEIKATEEKKLLAQNDEQEADSFVEESSGAKLGMSTLSVNARTMAKESPAESEIDRLWKELKRDPKNKDLQNKLRKALKDAKDEKGLKELNEFLKKN